ncbi:MAG: hypothetical protein ACOC4M_01540 [Promethearchaeia archaeon]
MNSNAPSTSEILEILREIPYGMICLNSLVEVLSDEELRQFALNQNVKTEKTIFSKVGFLLNLGVHYYVKYQNSAKFKKKFDDPLYFMGASMLSADIFNKQLIKFDFISQRELMNVFADFCADLGISVFNAREIPEYSLDLYLTRRTPLLRTEAVIVRTGVQLDEDSYQKTIELLDKASEIASWNVFVTTPLAVYQIGLQRIINDMKAINCWLYVVDPEHRRIMGITKGKSSNDYDKDLRNAYIEKLPSKSIRSPSQVVKISQYSFDEKESYDPSDFHTFELITKEEMKNRPKAARETAPYRNIFRNLLIIDQESGINILQYSSEQKSIDDDLISGFLTAMDNFIEELDGKKTLQEINYQGFYIQAGYGDIIKVALFLTKPSNQILKERLAYFIRYFEGRFEKQIAHFKQTGQTNVFSKQKFVNIAQNLLGI